MNKRADNYDTNATLSDNSCIVSGCTNERADNFEEDATTDDGSCVVSGCTNARAENFDSTANKDDGTCEILGCTDSKAANYDDEATEDDKTCHYPWLSPNTLYAGLGLNELDNSYQLAQAEFGYQRRIGKKGLRLGLEGTVPMGAQPGDALLGFGGSVALDVMWNAEKLSLMPIAWAGLYSDGLNDFILLSGLSGRTEILIYNGFGIYAAYRYAQEPLANGPSGGLTFRWGASN